MIIEEFHPEEMRAFATPGPADKGSTQSPLGCPLTVPSLLSRGTQNLNSYLLRSGPPASKIHQVIKPGYFSDVAPA